MSNNLMTKTQFIDATRSSADKELVRGKSLGARAGVNHSDRSPVFILGHGSSGTSILGQLLREELGIAFGTESQYIIRFYRRLDQYGDLSIEENRDRLIRHILQERWFSRSAKFGFKTDANSIQSRVKTNSYAGILDAIFCEFAEQIGMTRWGDKTPEYNLDLHVLGRLFPDAKFIHMVRDGRDVCVSLKERYWGPKNAYVAALQWKYGIGLVDDFLERLPAERKFETSYEKLSDEPLKVFSELLRFLEIEDSDGRILARLEDELPKKVRPGNHGKWKSSLTQRNLRMFESIAGKTLTQHGYDCQTDAIPKKTSVFQDFLWRLHNRLSKLTFGRYWGDNFYKAKLRILKFWQRIFDSEQ